MKRISNLIFIIFLFSFSLNIFGSSAFDCHKMARNIMHGHLKIVTPQFTEAHNDFMEHLKGLNYVEIIPWEPNHKDKAIRNLIRKHGIVTLLSKKIPEFDYSQKVGPSKVHINEIHFSQYHASNYTGEFTVIGNAHAFKKGELDPGKFPRIQVWRDVTGKIWSLDHRRLISMVMAGYDKELAVEFVPFEIFKEDRFKFSNMGDGNSIVLNLTRKDGPSKAPIAVVVSKPKNQIKITKKKSNTSLAKESEPATRKWEIARGEDYLLQLEKYATTLSEEYDLAVDRTKNNASVLFDGIAEVSTRAKSYDSVLAKLIKKDQRFFEEGKSITSLDDARLLIGDGIGIRALLKADSNGLIDKKSLQGFVDRLAADIEEGKLKVTEILNYRPQNEDSLAYLSEAQIKQIVEADLRLGLKLKAKGIHHKPIIVKSGSNTFTKFGYTSFQFNFSSSDGVLGEFQIRGKLIHEISETRHIFYDLKMNKPIAPNLLKNPVVAAAVKEFLNLSPDQKENYYNYIKLAMVHARKNELGIYTHPPKLPVNFATVLDLNMLKGHVLSVSH